MVSQPTVSYSETITSRTHLCVSKSSNKHNRLFANAEPLSDEVVKGIEDGTIVFTKDSKSFSNFMHHNYNWHKEDARRVWTFGCDEAKPNVLCDVTKGVQYMREIRDYVTNGFMQVAMEGVLAREVMRGVRFNIEDAKIYRIPRFDFAGQIIPCAKKVFYACQMAGEPRFMEPMYLVDISAPQNCQSGVLATLNARKAILDGVSQEKGSPMAHFKAYLPVAESFDFTEALREETGGNAFPQMIFSHWNLIPS